MSLRASCTGAIEEALLAGGARPDKIDLGGLRAARAGD
jgi:hypothetical protein